MQKKTIFICFSTSEGSLSDHFVQLSNQLSQNYEVVIFSDKKYKPKNLNHSISLKYWPSKRPTQIKDFVFYLKTILQKRPVLTISLFGSVNVNIISSYVLGVKFRIAWKRSLSTQFKQKKILILRKRLVYRLANIIITNSKSTAKDATQFHKINPKKLKVLPNSVADYYGLYKDYKTIQHKMLYVGRLHKSKGVTILIEAFKIIANNNKNIELVIVGSGPEMDNLKKLAKQSDYSQRIQFKGKKTKKEVLKEMKTAYVSVAPSLSEAFGFTVIEAMSMKTCVIGADNTGIAEIIKHNKTGLLFKTADANDLAEKLDVVLNNPKMRNRLAIEGYKHFKANYSTESAVKRDAEYFRNLIESS